MSERPTLELQYQTAFDEDGALVVAETYVETPLADFGAELDHRERESKIDRPEASTFGIDD